MKINVGGFEMMRRLRNESEDYERISCGIIAQQLREIT
jgi:hypothetical protein